MLHKFEIQVATLLAQLFITDVTTLIETKFICRKKISITVIVLLFYAAEHTITHIGQFYVTVKVLKNNIAK